MEQTKSLVELPGLLVEQLDSAMDLLDSMGELLGLEMVPDAVPSLAPGAAAATAAAATATMDTAYDISDG